MLYAKNVTFPAGKTELTKTIRHFHISKGWIYRAWVVFPFGCAGLVKVRVEHQGHPIIPINKSDYVQAKNYIFELPMYYEVPTEPFRITFEGWNEDETYPHTITLMLLVLPKNVILPIGATEGILESLSALVIRKGEEE